MRCRELGSERLIKNSSNNSSNNSSKNVMSCVIIVKNDERIVAMK